MFTKQTKNAAPADISAPPRKLAVASLIGDGVRMKGDIASDDDLHLDGVIEGDVSVRQLTIGEAGAVTGSIRAESVEVRGRVSGTITARQVRLCASAHVEGDVSHTEISIESGAHFAGRSLVISAPIVTSVVEPLSVAAE